MKLKKKNSRGARKPRCVSDGASIDGVKEAGTKLVWKPGTMLFPLPVVLVTSIDANQRPNVCTVAWAGTVCTEPPMVSISLRKATHSHGLITASGEFVINVPSARQVRATDYCGVVSGRDVDKFEKTGLTPVPASAVGPPLIRECPLHLECRTRTILELGSHTMFVAEVVAVQVTARLMTASGRLALEKAGLATFVHGGYYEVGRKLGYFGFSVRKKKHVKQK